ncbi:MAG: hypothetical protein L0H96_22325 [Humibacillus sp.]|nr:hypothetical protein [Humibacillus sp.]MDN5779632.1 hypothetical protein [Humibacillus sp.]
MDLLLRVISPEDWAVFRALRLRALADSPNAFGVTLAEATANAELIWRDRAGGPGPGVLARTLEELVIGADRMDRTVVLHVTQDNDARSLYERHGFVSTGEWQPLREGSETRIETMRRI